ncbi:MAG: nicotinate-nucleotide adenylyltransferase [Alphaproteobacteria bacterium]|nr:MAG: nicotinate-nucleotide adenylyltransferase [Caulobacteraceae bacterium]TPW06096.1 MAG: nicotinate-nucleotide adenylyltransferase [Alphaproteobacteria bacterium]
MTKTANRLKRAPLAYPGMRIGLFGGSFDPAHSGHLHVAETAMRRLGLDRVWWLVTPQNPLKPKSRPLFARMASAAAMTRGTRMVVTDLEGRLGLRYSADTIAALKRRWPGVHFVWIMGGDNMRGFVKWRRWRDIMRSVPIAVVAREKIASGALDSAAFAQFAHRRIPLERARTLPGAKAPAWTYISGHLDPNSSTAIRARD